MKNCIFFIIFFLLVNDCVQGQPTYDKELLEEMISFNEEMKSDRLIVSIKDTIIADVTFRGKPNDKFLIYSITKVFSGIAVGILIDKKLIKNPEVPIATFFEEWKDDTLKSKITIRHILQHTSGLSANNGSQDIYPQTDFVRYALNSSVVTEPGHTFFYNNKAINIISGVVNKVTGQSLEEFIRENVFIPLDINDYEWKHDQAGNTWCMDGLSLNATDLMKIGQMLCNFGEWNGKRILSKNWCEMMFQIPLTNSLNGMYGYAMAIKSLPIQEEISITSATVDTLNKLGLSYELTQKLRLLHNKANYKYLELGERLKQLFTSKQMEEISSFASQHMIPLYTILNGNFYIKHGGEYGLLMTAFPKRKKVVIRYLGEKWGRQKKEDGSDYKYLVDDEIVRYMLRL
ncbi:MAG: serine hydrolase [Saprospiraceae bacterium]|nr:serine hydrolase [Saprospiraceae bacterium]